VLKLHHSSGKTWFLIHRGQSFSSCRQAVLLWCEESQAFLKCSTCL